jgi:hypothetical protein
LGDHGVPDETLPPVSLCALQLTQLLERTGESLMSRYESGIGP